MKLIIAYIQPYKLNEVKQELFKDDIHKISITTSKGCGQQKGFVESYRGVETEVNLLDKMRIEIAVNDDFVEKTTAAIVRGARTGAIGDGKIFVLPIEKTIRIRSGEEGTDAIG
ncbi:MAG: P-II family nitrogen regulator [Spirochaetaceae bacterium]